MGSSLYSTRAIDWTINAVLNGIVSQHVWPTKLTKMKMKRRMDYTNTYPDAYIRYYANWMGLNIDTDSAYLMLPKAKIRVPGYFYFGNPSQDINVPV